MSDDLVFTSYAPHGVDGAGERAIEAWRKGVEPSLELESAAQDDQQSLHSIRRSAQFPGPSSSSAVYDFATFSPSPASFGSPVVGPPLDAQDESFLALAALHDPELFSSPSPIDSADGADAPPRTPPPVDRVAEAADGPSSFTSGLELDFGRGRRRQREEKERRAREESVAERSAMSPRGMTRRVLSNGIKVEASVEVHVKSVASSPLISSPQFSPSSASSPRSGQVAASKHARNPSAASDQLLRLQSSSPLSPHSSPSSPHSPHIRPGFKRRYSSIHPSHPASGGEKAADLPQTAPLLRAHSHHHHPPVQQHLYGSVKTLNKYFDGGRRSSLPAAPLLTGGTATPDCAPPHSPEHVHAHGRKRSNTHCSPLPHAHPGSSASLFSTFSFADHLPSLPFRPPHLGFHTAPSLSPRCPSPAPASSVFPATSIGAGGEVRWSSIRALHVRFRPSGGEDGSSLGANAWVLGLQALAAGGERQWDPRQRDGGKEGREKGAWPLVSTAVGSPPCVEVVYEGGGRRTCHVAGLGEEDIMRVVLAPPV
ncbi:hypothetical protein JCM10213_001823 [Rhodosporidiobolus nylandii]